MKQKVSALRKLARYSETIQIKNIRNKMGDIARGTEKLFFKKSLNYALKTCTPKNWKI